MMNIRKNKYEKLLIKNPQTKFKILAVIIFIFLFTACNTGCIDSGKNSIKISGAFALYPMMGIWSEEYQKLHPDIKIELSAGGAGKGMSDAIQGLVDIGMVSREIYQSEIDQGIFWISVCKDAVVATINENNPAYESIKINGISKKNFIDIFINRSIETWGELVNDSTNTELIKVYTRSDSCGAAQTWALYLGAYYQDDLTNAADSAINGDPNLAAAIQSDINGIGYNNINFVYDSESKSPFDGLKPVPIDLNENGVLDSNEKFYETRDEIVQAIASDIYPSPPSRALHLVTKRNFSVATEEFINFILTEGQQYIPENGYIQLSSEIIDQQLEYLNMSWRPELED